MRSWQKELNAALSHAGLAPHLAVCDFLSQYYESIVRKANLHVYSKLQRHIEPADIWQDALLKLMNHPAPLRSLGLGPRLAGYIARVLTNCLIDRWKHCTRSAAPNTTLDLCEELYAPPIRDDPVQNAIQNEMLETIKRRAEHDTRFLAMQWALEGKSFDEIAADLKVTEKHVRRMIGQALKELKRLRQYLQ